MAVVEDAAAVLEQFIHDVANLPAEVAHLFEEAQAKQDIINECTKIIENRDTALQRFIKQAGSLTVNPKEEQYNKTIRENFARAEALQEEKVALIQKASSLLDRYVKRLDFKIRDLQNEGAMPADPQMPTLLHESPGNIVPPTSSVNTGTSTPLQNIPVNTISSANLNNATVVSLQRAAGLGRMGSPIGNGAQAPQTNSPSHISSQNIAREMLNRNRREGSQGVNPNNRLNRPSHLGLGNLPAQSSSLVRQTSLGPGTPKPGTPGANGGRAGSAGPRSRKHPAPSSRRPDPRHQLLRRKKGIKSGLKKSRTRHLTGSARASPSTTGEDSGASEDGSEDEHGSYPGAGEDHDMDDEGADDLTKYCYCQKVSYGDMVACDNSDCKGQWFHWDCAGLTSEPLGEWLCRDCARLPRNKIRKA
ncbi:hypothetical protein EJ08DRAFT_616923 [Tothia fuscella]|uniref:Chromatin modification-related protein n=1 Tax=Tothia fuscella TaxID=1048955 RepID=A0A9P4NL03_9PEZI|nr:hypothetical protein EJ08DRAFT_616923 [Tothia fuscella]